jgi:murein DD-endopeptidase MepM/ murein hydrolase activator NlpD
MIKRVLLGLALAVVSVASTASADTFRLLPAMPTNLPSASLPNEPGQISVPTPISTPPARPQTLDFQQLTALWQQAGQAYGIPWQVLAAINKVESNFGRNMGPSSAGAVGWMQFMPSTWERWGMDADGDGIADPWSPQDAVYGAARYLAASGGTSDISRAVLSYNHAQWYVDEVLQLAQTFVSGGFDTTYKLDRLQVSLDSARRQLAEAGQRLARAKRAERKLAVAEARALRRAQGVALLSRQLELQKAATLVGVRHHGATVRVERLTKQLDDARAGLERARTRIAAVPAASTAGAMFAAPTVEAGYVFPVGGGPSLVSVAHTHHDYPAADIAAPEGSPVYALAGAVVIRSWTAPDPACGIGLTLRTADTQEWTYCHLSYLEATVTAGAVLNAGDPVGLVGHTGDATGPHLHLQLDPPRSYPQNQPWFQQFAGVAFRWQDAPTPQVPTTTTAASGRPVFAEVRDGAVSSAASAGVIRFTR